MAFPLNPTNGQTATVNNIGYYYDSSLGAWTRQSGSSYTGGNLTVTGNILPGSNVTYNIGTTTQRFASLYLSGNTIDLGGATIKTDATTGAVALIAQPTAANPNPTGIVISPTGAISTVATTAGVVSANAVATASNAATPTTIIPLISNVTVTDSSWNVLDDTAIGLSGGYVRLTGSGFDATSSVLFNTASATAVTYGNSTTLYVQTPVLTTGTYSIYVVNSTGATGIRVNGLTASTFTAWTTAATLGNVTTAQSFGVNLSATSDSTITYANTTALPVGTTLASNGYFYGTTTVGATTTYTFTVNATDTENQNATRTFSLTVTVVPPVYLYSWGKNADGALGLNDNANRSSPVQVGSLGTWLKISTGNGNYSSGAIKADGTLWTWGQGIYGNLGTNDVISRSSPVQVGALTTWSDVECGGYNFVAIKTDGTLWTWGWNNTGQLGTNDLIRRSSPVQVGTDTNWSKASIGNLSGMVAIKTNGTLWTWGSGFAGSLGTNTTLERSSPAQVGAGTNWLIAKRGYGHVAAIKTDGTLWTWGWNTYGQLGRNIVYQNTSSPVQVGTGTTWSNAAVYNNATMVTKTDGTLWLWGYNNYGQLGQNDVVTRSSPVQLGSGTTWNNKISMGNFAAAAIKTDGTLWVWGNGTNNAGGALGLNNPALRSSPTQVGAGTTWLDVNIGYRTIAISS